MYTRRTRVKSTSVKMYARRNSIPICKSQSRDRTKRETRPFRYAYARKTESQLTRHVRTRKTRGVHSYKTANPYNVYWFTTVKTKTKNYFTRVRVSFGV